MRNWYIKTEDNPDITWYKNSLFRSSEWLNLKGYIEEVIGVTTVPPHTHSISDVNSLQTSLDAKVDENAAIIGATKTKITYDTKGLVTSGTDATTADIADSTNKRYVTDAQLVVITNTSGTNTGDQTSIVGLSGTKAEFNTACSDGDFLYVGDVTGVTVASTNLNTQSAAIGATTLYTTPAADGFYQICWVATVTRAATTSSTLGPFQFRYTNAADNVAKTWPSSNVNNVNQAATNNTGTGVISGTQTMYCKASTTIQYIMGYTSSGATTMQYSLDITVIKL